MAFTTLPAQVREDCSKRARKGVRHAGNIPGNLHGTEGARALALEGKPWTMFLRTDQTGHLIELDLGSAEKELATIREIQREPLFGGILHIDLLHIARGQTTTFELAVHTVGKPKGVEDGGVLTLHMPHVKIRCTPDSLPNDLPINVRAVILGGKLHASDLELPPGVELETPGEALVVSVDAIRVKADVVEAAAEAEVVAELAAPAAVAGKAPAGKGAPAAAPAAGGKAAAAAPAAKPGGKK